MQGFIDFASTLEAQTRSLRELIAAKGVGWLATANVDHLTEHFVNELRLEPIEFDSRKQPEYFSGPHVLRIWVMPSTTVTMLSQTPFGTSKWDGSVNPGRLRVSAQDGSLDYPCSDDPQSIRAGVASIRNHVNNLNDDIASRNQQLPRLVREIATQQIERAKAEMARRESVSQATGVRVRD